MASVSMPEAKPPTRRFCILVTSLKSSRPTRWERVLTLPGRREDLCD